MSVKLLFAGIAIGIVLMSGIAITDDVARPDINADKICNNRFAGDGWTGEKMNSAWENKSATLSCTKGNRTETIGVDIDIEVES